MCVCHISINFFYVSVQPPHFPLFSCGYPATTVYHTPMAIQPPHSTLLCLFFCSYPATTLNPIAFVFYGYPGYPVCFFVAVQPPHSTPLCFFVVAIQPPHSTILCLFFVAIQPPHSTLLCLFLVAIQPPHSTLL